MAILSTIINDSYTTIFTSPTTVDSSAVTAIYFCNTGAGTANLNICLVASGDIASSNNMVYYNLAIAPSDTYVIDTERLVLGPSDSIVAVSTVNGTVVATVSYMEI